MKTFNYGLHNYELSLITNTAKVLDFNYPNSNAILLNKDTIFNENIELIDKLILHLILCLRTYPWIMNDSNRLEEFTWEIVSKLTNLNDDFVLNYADYLSYRHLLSTNNEVTYNEKVIDKLIRINADKIIILLFNKPYLTEMDNYYNFTAQEYAMIVKNIGTIIKNINLNFIDDYLNLGNLRADAILEIMLTLKLDYKRILQVFIKCNLSLSEYDFVKLTWFDHLSKNEIDSLMSFAKLKN